MTSAFPGWTGPPRRLAMALDATVAAAGRAERDGFDEGLTDLASLDRDRVGVLLGAVTRDLVEHAFPDGLDTDDVEQLLRDCVSAATPWWPDIEADHLIRALTGALGVSETEETPADPAVVLVHGVLLVAQLLVQCDVRFEPLLDGALQELMRAQTVEFP